MSSSISQEAILQAILELSDQLKETKADLKEDLKRLEDKVENIDAKFEVLNSALLSTRADVQRLKKVL